MNRLTLAALAFFVVACGHPGEGQALERLSATEASAEQLVASAIGSGALTAWERSTLPVAIDPSCSRCWSTNSWMTLEGLYPREVVESIAEVTRNLGGDVEHTGSNFSTESIQVRLGSDLYSIQVYWHGLVDIVIATGSYRGVSTVP